MHRTMSAGLVLLAAEAFIIALSFKANLTEEIFYWQRLRFKILAFLPGIWLVFSMSLGRTDYHDYIKKWKWIIICIFVFPLALATIFGNKFFIGEAIQTADNNWLIRLGWSGYFFHLIFLVGAVLILMNMERILRASMGRIRWQIKFIVLGIGGYFAVRIYEVSQNILFKSLTFDLLKINTAALIIAGLLILKALPRAQGLNIDFYISSNFLYNSLAVLFVGIYLVAVGFLAQLISSLGLFAEAQKIPITALLIFLALLGLAIFLLSDRLRKKLKIFVSRHFRRPIYDYRKEWMDFTRDTTSILDIKDLCRVATQKISRTIEALSVTIWLIDEEKEDVRIGGSTAFSEKHLTDNQEFKNQILSLIKVVRQQNLPPEYDYAREEWMKEDRINGKFYKDFHIRHCLPLIAGGNFLGILTVGDKVGQEEFSIEDIDLIKTVADQVASSLLNIQLSKQLGEVKEAEAFRTISAFILHDLKNIASTLSLTMQNLPLYYDNPEFRQDAVRITEQSLAKINNLCSGLSALSQKIEIKKKETNLHELILNVFSSLNIAPSPAKVDNEAGNEAKAKVYEWKLNGNQISVIYSPQVMNNFFIDPEQIQKVLINLLLNAKDALKDKGEIRIDTRQNENQIEISVSDNGCGMSKEFIEKSLFRPFKTTKKKGMGIGLFQSKMIIEAHGGRLEVESEEKVGTKFRILIPG